MSIHSDNSDDESLNFIRKKSGRKFLESDESDSDNEILDKTGSDIVNEIFESSMDEKRNDNQTSETSNNKTKNDSEIVESSMNEDVKGFEASTPGGSEKKRGPSFFQRTILTDNEENIISGTSAKVSSFESYRNESKDNKELSSILVEKKDNEKFQTAAFTTPQKSVLNLTDSDDEDESEKYNISDSDSGSDFIDDSLIEESLCDTEKKKILPPLRFKKSTNQLPKQQPTLDKFVSKDSPKDVIPEEKAKTECTRAEYNKQIEKIGKFEEDMRRAKHLLSTMNLAKLPDHGEMLRTRFEKCKNDFLNAQEQLKQMVVIEDEAQANPNERKWNDLQAGMAVVQPKTFGKKGLQEHNAQRALTAECLEQLHGSLKNCPTSEHLEEDPAGMKVELMPHQKRALAWLLFRETQRPAGGILADDMGLGKTLTMISLILKSKSRPDENEPEGKYNGKYNGGTLVVCPASLIHQWAGEIDSKLKRGRLSYEIYHGPKRELKPKRIAEHDVVITTYAIVMNECDKGAIFRVRWRRIILDEAHTIRNHKARTSIACCELAGKTRWALTGTPVHNKELDMYGLLKFLRCSPFDDLAVWKRWVGDKGSGGGERLHTVISTIMLRRTKLELMQEGKLDSLPSKQTELKMVALDEEEMGLYHKVLLFSQKLFAQFLHQRAEKNQDIMDLRNPNSGPNNEYFKMRQKLLRMNGMREVAHHEILLLLLRLRQICCHPSLILNMLQGDEDLGDNELEEKNELNLLEQLNRLNLEDDNNASLHLGEEAVALSKAAKNILNPSHPIFAIDRLSSKIKVVMELLPNILSAGDKTVIVSQWKSYLELVGLHLKANSIKFLQFDGSVPTAKRNEIISKFNDVNSSVKVLLLSLTAGGVGLNLIAGNHLFLLDLHWNPQLENQAQDRIYRMGQKKKVYIYKFMATETIEERIQKLQEDKLAMAQCMIDGTKQVINSKLSLQDLKMLFNM